MIQNQRGSVIMYIFIAIGLLGALTLSMMDADTEDVTSQRVSQTVEKLYSQAQAIQSAIMECVAMYPDGGGDLNNDGDIDTDDNPNSPYPLSPTDPNNPGGAALDNEVKDLKCPGAPAGQELIFSADKGRFAPDSPVGFEPWKYRNITPDNILYNVKAEVDTEMDILILDRLQAKFAVCETERPAANTLRIWIKRSSCT